MAALQIAGERTSGQDVRTQNATAVLAVANILKNSLGPVGLDKVCKLGRPGGRRGCQGSQGNRPANDDGLIITSPPPCLPAADAGGRHWRCDHHQRRCHHPEAAGGGAPRRTGARRVGGRPGRLPTNRKKCRSSTPPYRTKLTNKHHATPCTPPHPTFTCRQILVELAELQDQEVGDGTTSVVIVAAELLKRANELGRAKVHPPSIISGYRLAMREVRETCSGVRGGVGGWGGGAAKSAVCRACTRSCCRQPVAGAPRSPLPRLPSTLPTLPTLPAPSHPLPPAGLQVHRGALGHPHRVAGRPDAHVGRQDGDEQQDRRRRPRLLRPHRR